MKTMLCDIVQLKLRDELLQTKELIFNIYIYVLSFGVCVTKM